MVRLSLLRSMAKFHPRSITAEPVPSNLNLAGQFVIACGIVYSGYYLDSQSHNRLTRFRDSSALYKGINPDPENNPSWGDKEYKWKFTVA